MTSHLSTLTATWNAGKVAVPGTIGGPPRLLEVIHRVLLHQNTMLLLTYTSDDIFGGDSLGFKFVRFRIQPFSHLQPPNRSASELIL